MSMDNDQDNGQFWSSLLQSFGDSDPKDYLYPEISTPIVNMSTSMTIDVMSEPWKELEARDKEDLMEKFDVEGGSKNINGGGEKSIQKDIVEKMKEDPKEENKSLGKRPRSNESRNLAEKKRRTNIRTKIETLKELTHITTKADLASTIESIVERIREMKIYVETYPMGPVMPLGMGMDFPGPWYSYAPPYYMHPFNNFTQGESSSHAIYQQQIVPLTPNTKEYNNQQYPPKFMYS